MRDVATPQGGHRIIDQPARFVGLIMMAAILAVAYGFTVDGMLRPDVGPALMLSVIAWFAVVGGALLAFPDRTGWLIGPALISGYPVWIAGGRAVQHPELLLTSAYLIFVLASLAVLGSTRWFLLAVVATMPVLTIGAWGQFPTGYGLAFRVIGDGLDLIMISGAVFFLGRRQERLVQRLHDLAGSDPLTQLPNRRRLDEVAADYLCRAQDAGALFAVLILDLDHFKQVNDRHGHATGDQVLITVSEDLTALLGPQALLARTGGEELLVLAVVRDSQEADALGERVRALVAGGSSPVPVTCSMGIAAVAPPASRMDAAQAAGWLWDVAAVADRAMYEAKHAGRNCVVRASTTFVPQPAPRAAPAVPAAPAEPLPRRTLPWALLWTLPARSSTADGATRLLGLRLGGGMALVCIALLVLVDRWTVLLMPGPWPRALFIGIVVHGLVIGAIAVLRPQSLPRFAAAALVFGCLSWSAAPMMYRSPELFVSPAQLLMICGIAALVVGARGLVVVLGSALPALWIALSHNDYPPSGLLGQVVLNGSCVLAASVGIHLLRRRNERVRERLQVLSMTDPLTSLPNRRHVQESAAVVVERAASQGRKVASLLIDLDRFKDLNDTHGHAVGDEVLIAVTAAIVPRLGPGDLLARAGGEEFLLLSVVTGLDTASALAEQVRCAVEQMSGDLPVTCSIGVAAGAPEPGLAAESAAEWVWSLTAVADRAMYQAKLAGRNRVVTADSVHPGAQTRRTIGASSVRRSASVMGSHPIGGGRLHDKR